MKKQEYLEHFQIILFLLFLIIKERQVILYFKNAKNFVFQMKFTWLFSPVKCDCIRYFPHLSFVTW